MTVIILIAVIVILAIWIVSLYNSLVKLRNNRENAFADIDVQLKQRHDLIPQLVETVKGYASHEKETLERVINARNGAISAKTIDDKIMAENVLTSALAGKKVLVIHPFEESIQNQYKHFDKLFPGTDILPEFELKTLKAVQTAGSATDARFATWFDALDYMCRECEKIDFGILAT